MGATSEWVFGYGSLAAAQGAAGTGGAGASAAGTSAARGAYPTELLASRRWWGVAMDNRVDLPGYKWYRERASGERADGLVAFLDVAGADGGSAVNGLCLPVDAHALARLDARERNYERIDVTSRVAHARGRVWMYAGSAAGRARLAQGVHDQSLLISQEYIDDVEHAFRGLGDGALAAYRASTDPPPPGAEIVALERIDLP
ncbi:MAG TPA: gamma-glutamylcyclotransferase family protein [Conexibacter sp.]